MISCTVNDDQLYREWWSVVLWMMISCTVNDDQLYCEWCEWWSVVLWVMISCTVNDDQIEVESTVEHPFFVYNRGWSSCAPERTLQRYRLDCRQLLINDQCISLTQKTSSALVPTTSFMNGSVAWLKDWHVPVTHPQPVSNLSRSRLASDSAVLSCQVLHGKS